MGSQWPSRSTVASGKQLQTTNAIGLALTLQLRKANCDTSNRRFILEQLVGPVPTEGEELALPSIAAKDRNAQYLLERGLLEVDGKPRDGRERPHEGEWSPGELMDGVTDLTRGQR